MSPFMLDRRYYNCGALYRGTSTKQTLLFCKNVKVYCISQSNAIIS